jgi:hypothetical protein
VFHVKKLCFSSGKTCLYNSKIKKEREVSRDREEGEYRVMTAGVCCYKRGAATRHDGAMFKSLVNLVPSRPMPPVDVFCALPSMLGPPTLT